MTDAEDKTSTWEYVKYIATKSKVYILIGICGTTLLVLSSWVEDSDQIVLRSVGISLIITSGLLTYMVKTNHKITGEIHAKLDTLIGIGESTDKKIDTLIGIGESTDKKIDTLIYICESTDKKLDKLDKIPEISEKLDKLPDRIAEKMSEKLDKLNKLDKISDTLESINKFLREQRNESRTNPPYHA
jgi:low affinity Fe/Cu permease